MDTEHSPTNASGMERWQVCSGSVNLIKKLRPAELEREEPEFTKNGTAAHEVAKQCLRDGREPWEFLGETIEGVEVPGKITDAVQKYVDECSPIMAGAEAVYIEHQFADPTVHRDFRGTVDFAALKDGTLYVRDFKNGVLAVDATSPQFKYYAYAMLLMHPEARRCSLGVVQPNGFHSDGPVRTWECSAEDLHDWANNELLPAMARAERGGELVAGDHCRFCPLKIMCPKLQGEFGAMTIAEVKGVHRLTDEQLAHEYKMADPVKMYCKAVDEEVYHRMMNGRSVPGFKLVAKRGTRLWKPEAEATFEKTYGDNAYHPPEFKSPAQMELIGALAKDLVKQYSYTPNDTGATVAPESSTKPAITVKSMQSAFANVIDDKAEIDDI